MTDTPHSPGKKQHCPLVANKGTASRPNKEEQDTCWMNVRSCMSEHRLIALMPFRDTVRLTFTPPDNSVNPVQSITCKVMPIGLTPGRQLYSSF
ncbi:hypothetical protein NQZ68_010845 [Dissostichus eleginoides]|nr:hypothetical protein NQZ68_010845 [Dissostichus eleginoides]